MLPHNVLAQLIKATQSVTHNKDVSLSLNALQQWQDTLWQALQTNAIQSTELNPEGNLAEQIEQLNIWLTQAQHDSQTASHRLDAAKQLIRQFEQAVMLLIFGKFNAGKSSLCNALAACFRQQQQAVTYFHLDKGEIRFTDEPFKEGATETTARLQGVCLGEQLVLLDTPGLHSVTADNADLTQRFLESADGMLWLSSSSSPGQVHELDSLAQELLRQKPLLPIITRSDYFEEDEVDGELCHVLCNKSAEQRHIQEQDVKARATQKLEQMHADITLLKDPISISAYMASQAHFEPAAMTEAGFERLFLALDAFITPAIAYKQRKPAEIVLHCLQEQIIMPLKQNFKPKLTQFERNVQAEIDSLTDKQTHVITQVWREIVPTLPALLDTYRPILTTENLLADIGVTTHKALQHAVQITFTNAIIHVPQRQSLTLQNSVIYQAEDENFRPQIDETLLYNNICDSLTYVLQQATDTLVKDYTSQLQDLLEQIQAVKDTIAHYQHQLADIAVGLRH